MSETAQQHAVLPDDQQLTAKLSSRWAFKPVHLGAASLFGILFLYCNWMPLYPTDLWGHVLYGNWIVEQRRLPTEDPFVPLARGIPIVDTAWLSQVILALVERGGGADWLSHLYALTMLTTFLILAGASYLRTRSWGLSLIGIIASLGLSWGRLAFIRPEIFGVLCFAILLWLVALATPIRTKESTDRTTDRRQPGWFVWVSIPLLFVVWANLHGTFAIGLVVLGCCSLGESVDAVRRSRRMLAAVSSSEARRWWILTALAVLSTLVNPYGVKLLIDTIKFSQNPNLQYVTEWFRLELVSFAGLQVALSWLALMILLRHSRRRFTATDILLLAVFSCAVCLRVRFLNWYVCVAVFVLLPHLQSLLVRRAQQQRFGPELGLHSPVPQLSFRYTLVSALVVWACLGLSPLGVQSLTGRSRPARQLYNRNTPRGISQYLREHPPQGLLFCPQSWGDWLLWDGPPGMRVFVTTNSLHVIKPRAWRDCLLVGDGAADWEAVLARYQVKHIAIAKSPQPDLIRPDLSRLVRESPRWTLVYEDGLGVVFCRKS
ncbi:MAG: hypothetical protein NTY19_39025 [Planctomycetota bacterium]|nr:hypothetical protein [Planctomycetota bacterium]